MLPRSTHFGDANISSIVLMGFTRQHNHGAHLNVTAFIINDIPSSLVGQRF